MKTRKIFAFVLAFALALSLMACGGSSSASSQEPAKSTETSTEASAATAESSAPAEAQEPAASTASGETYELAYSMHDGATTLKFQYTDEWTKQLADATDGALNITIYPGAALASADTVLEALSTGACDMAMVYTTYYDDVFSIANGITLPMLGIESAQEATNILWDLYEQSPEMAAEFDDYVLIHMYSNGCSYLQFADKAVNTFDGLKGLKLRSGGGAMTDFLTACGAVPMTIATPELYEALEKKLVDGNISTGSMTNSWNLYEVDKYLMDMPLYVGVWLTLMNKDSFNKLPADVQEAIMAAGGREASLVNAEALQGENDEAYQKAVDAGCEWLHVEDAEVAKFYEAAQSYNQQWISDHTTDSFDAQAYYDLMLDLVDKY